MFAKKKDAQAPEREARELTPEEKRAELKRKVIREVREWIVSLVVALVVVMLIRTFLFTIIRVDGESMVDTLAHNERMFVTILDRKLYGVERGDVVICRYPGRGSTYFVKRVRGVPGDTVERANNVTYVNGEAIDPKRESSLYARADYTHTLGEDEYFCVGDNIYNSHDSRAWMDDSILESQVVGPLSGDMIIGKVRYVIWPLTEIREVD